MYEQPSLVARKNLRRRVEPNRLVGKVIFHIGLTSLIKVPTTGPKIASTALLSSQLRTKCSDKKGGATSEKLRATHRHGLWRICSYLRSYIRTLNAASH